ncbi:sensor histidine kinase [Mucilaginibacter kameinonensis]|uniref:sensor histidine kinase n=1 Tax=Mucilaginibacter kameinonensis TaxID=452286 RepID=UPI0013CE846C|nr:HAMP domain-containing sensor histidine kinase [Mucilaginibacter kameinonensis]
MLGADNPRRNGDEMVMLRTIRKDHLIRLMRDYCYAVSNISALEAIIQVTLTNGEEKWLKIIGMPVQRQWGKVEEMAGTVQDISQKVCEENFGLSVISHELRNPLTIAVLNTQLAIKMLAKDENNAAVNFLRNAETHLNGMTTLMEEYLTTSGKSRQQQLNASVFDLNKLVDVLLTEMGLIHRYHRFVKVNHSPCLVKADKFKIIQVFINYITNAVTHSPMGTPITVALVNGSHHVEVSVIDRGSGIPDGSEELIFDKYYSGAAKEKSRHNKGLGLYLVKNIVERHGGTVRAIRNKNCGSSFFFSLPVLTA